MLDFSSALYLGLHHPSRALRPWTRLSTGKPSALDTPAEPRRVARKLAQLVGCEQAVLGPSTLHLFWDIFGVLAHNRIAVCLDAGAYPIARWGAQRAAALGKPLHLFRHHDPERLGQLLRQAVMRRMRPVVVADGFCPGCGRPAPLQAYLQLVQALGGVLVLDDTQALGVLGQAANTAAPYGTGGGGILRWSGIEHPAVVIISSLAKGLGVPVAMLAGRRKWVQVFVDKSETRQHCSPPSAAVISAAEHALLINEQRGDQLRQNLALRVRQFRQGLVALNIRANGGWFPLQTLRTVSGISAPALHSKLSDHGVRTVLHHARQNQRPALSFLLNARQQSRDIEHALQALQQSLVRPRPVRTFLEIDHVVPARY